MIRYILLIAISLVIAGCGSKPKQSQDFVFGSQLYGKFTNYYLKGEARLAEHSFRAAESQFLKIDGLCNLSRIYIGRFVLDEGQGEVGVLERASEYARLGKCENEREIILYLMGKDYEKRFLPEPYRSVAGAGREYVEFLAGSNRFPDVTRSRLYRRASVAYLKSRPSYARGLAEKALEIDKFYGWSVNILRDLIIIRSSLVKEEKDTADIDKRIKLIRLALDKK